MMRPYLLASMLAASAVLAMAGCSSSKVLRGPLEVTIGQQLIDLKKARDVGALSASEYDDQRTRLIRAAE